MTMFSEVLHEGQTQRVDESAEAAHREVQAVAEEHNHHEGQPLPGRMYAQQHGADLVESAAQHAAGQAKCVEADVTQHIAQDAGCHLVRVPEPGADVQQRVASRLVEDEDAQDGKHADRNDGDLRGGGIQHVRQGQCRDAKAAHDEDDPSPGGNGLLEARAPGQADGV